MNTSRILFAVLTCFLLACEGPVGPAGPAGPAGPQGPQGLQGPPGISGVFFGTIVLPPNGTATLILQDAQVETSVINCYMSQLGTAPWFLIAWNGNTPYCTASNVGPDLHITLFGGAANAGWTFMATVVT